MAGYFKDGKAHGAAMLYDPTTGSPSCTTCLGYPWSMCAAHTHPHPPGAAMVGAMFFEGKLADYYPLVDEDLQDYETLAACMPTQDRICENQRY